MNHLSNNELQSLIDGAIMNGERSRLMAHLEECDRCRREIEFHRSVTRVARALPPVKPSAHFTERVMTRIAPREQPAWLRWTLNNLGNIFGMIFVLGVLGYFLTTPKLFTFQTSNEPSKITEALQTYNGLYDNAKTFIVGQAEKLKGNPPAVSAATDETGKIPMMVVSSLLLLVLLDRFVFQRISRVRMR